MMSCEADAAQGRERTEGHEDAEIRDAAQRHRRRSTGPCHLAPKLVVL